MIFFLDFSILYDDGVVKKQAGSTRLTMVAIIKSRQTCAWCIQLGTRRCDPNLQDAVRTEPLKTQSDEFGLKEGKMPVCDGNWYLAARKYDYVPIIYRMYLLSYNKYKIVVFHKPKIPFK